MTRGNLQEMMPALITGRGGQMMTPEEIARQREMAAALMQSGGDTSPVQHWSQGLARLVDAWGGYKGNMRANEATARNAEHSQSIMQSLLGGMGGGSTPQLAPAFTPQPGGGMPAAMGAGGAPASVPTGDRAGYIREGLINRGLPAHVADAFIVNFQDESGLNPGINEIAPLVPGSRGGYGLYQLTGPRRRDYEAFASQRGVAASDVDAQLDWLMHELQGPEARAAQSILGAPDTASAAQAIVNNFLRPAEGHRSSRARRYAGLGNTASPEGIQVADANGPSPDIMQALMGGVENAQSAMGGQQPMQMAQAAPSQPYQPPAPPQINPAILEALSSPYVDDQARSIAQMLFQQHGQQQQAAVKAANEYNQLQDQRAYDYGLQQMEWGREDQRNAVSDQFDRERIEISRQGLTPTDVREFEYGNQNPGFFDYQERMRRSGATNITTNVGEGDKFYENLDRKNADTFSALSETGMQARAKAAQIDRLDELLQRAPQGASAMLKQAAGEYGINTEGLSDIQAAQALINELVPQQRQPGSGPMSDADLALYKASLPRLINQPEGNRLIVETMRNIARYQVQMGDIADLVADREISPAEARRMIRELANPLEGFGERASSFQAPQQGPQNGEAPSGWEEEWEYLTPEERKQVLGNG